MTRKEKQVQKEEDIFFGLFPKGGSGQVMSSFVSKKSIDNKII